MPEEQALQFKRWRQSNEKSKDTPRDTTPLAALSERMQAPVTVEEIQFLQDNNVRAAQTAARNRRIAAEHHATMYPPLIQRPSIAQGLKPWQRPQGSNPWPGWAEAQSWAQTRMIMDYANAQAERRNNE